MGIAFIPIFLFPLIPGCLDLWKLLVVVWDLHGSAGGPPSRKGKGLAVVVAVVVMYLALLEASLAMLTGPQTGIEVDLDVFTTALC